MKQTQPSFSSKKKLTFTIAEGVSGFEKKQNKHLMSKQLAGCVQAQICTSPSMDKKFETLTKKQSTYPMVSEADNVTSRPHIPSHQAHINVHVYQTGTYVLNDLMEILQATNVKSAILFHSIKCIGYIVFASYFY